MTQQVAALQWHTSLCDICENVDFWTDFCPCNRLHEIKFILFHCRERIEHVALCEVVQHVAGTK